MDMWSKWPHRTSKASAGEMLMSSFKLPMSCVNLFFSSMQFDSSHMSRYSRNNGRTAPWSVRAARHAGHLNQLTFPSFTKKSCLTFDLFDSMFGGRVCARRIRKSWRKPKARRHDLQELLVRIPSRSVSTVYPQPYFKWCWWVYMRGGGRTIHKAEISPFCCFKSQTKSGIKNSWRWTGFYHFIDEVYTRSFILTFKSIKVHSRNGMISTISHNHQLIIAIYTRTTESTRISAKVVISC